MQNDKTHPKISCDSCGKEIKQPQDGIIRWKWLPREGRLDCRSFAIVHRGECDDRLGYPSGSGFHHIEHVQEMFDYFVDSQVRAIKQGHCLVDCEGLAEVFNRVNPRRSYEKLYRLFHQAQRSAEARLNRHIQSIHGRVREITSTLIEIRFHKLHPSAFEATLVDVRNLLLTKFGPSSPMIEQMAVLEKQLAALPSDFRLEDKCDMLENSKPFWDRNQVWPHHDMSAQAFFIGPSVFGAGSQCQAPLLGSRHIDWSVRL